MIGFLNPDSRAIFGGEGVCHHALAVTYRAIGGPPSTACVYSHNMYIYSSLPLDGKLILPQNLPILCQICQLNLISPNNHPNQVLW